MSDRNSFNKAVLNSPLFKKQYPNGIPARVQPAQTAKVPVPAEKLKPLSARDKLNKTEAEFLRHLELGVYGKMDSIGIHCITLKIGDDCRYTPEFFTVQGSNLRLWEVKGGHIWEDSIIKLKTAAQQYPVFTFVKAQKTKDGWQVKVVDRA